jgi:hypothetical protein
MPIIESPLSIRPSTDDISPRQPHREIAELLATAIVRARLKGAIALEATQEWQDSEVCLGFSGDQSVHTNPSQPEGVFV